MTNPRGLEVEGLYLATRPLIIILSAFFSWIYTILFSATLIQGSLCLTPISVLLLAISELPCFHVESLTPFGRLKLNR